MANTDTTSLIDQIKVAKIELGKTVERMMGAQRKAIGLRTRREVTQSDVEGQIKNLELFAKQRLQIDREIDVAAKNLEEERARRLQIADIEDRYTADVQELFESATMGREILVETHTGKPPVSRSSDKWKNLSPDMKTLSKLLAAKRVIYYCSLLVGL